jgi:hypothetical protein
MAFDTLIIPPAVAGVEPFPGTRPRAIPDYPKALHALSRMILSCLGWPIMLIINKTVFFFVSSETTQSRFCAPKISFKSKNCPLFFSYFIIYQRDVTVKARNK